MANEFPWWLLVRIAAGRSHDFAGAAPPVDFGMLGDWLLADIGDRIDRTHHLVEHPPEDVRLEIEGYTETIRHRGWAVQLNAEPYDPWQIGLLAGSTGDTSTDLGRLAGDDNAAIRAAITSTGTSIAFDPNAFRWTIVADDFDPDLRVRFGGELAEVSSIATTAATFVAAGTADHDNNAAVDPGLPAGATTNDLLLVFAAIRNSGTGRPDTPAGYTRLPIFGSTDNAQVFAKVHTGTETAPNITFSGSVANADTSAQMCAFRNMPISLSDLADVVLAPANTQLNATAQNVAVPPLSLKPYPGQVVLAFCWKQDDWTSATSPTGFTEIGEFTTTAGDDQGCTWGYRIDTTPAVVSDASFTITGGATAISRSAVAAIAGGFQTMTVSARSVNGVVKSHAAGTLIEVADPLIAGL